LKFFALFFDTRRAVVELLLDSVAARQRLLAGHTVEARQMNLVGFVFRPESGHLTARDGLLTDCEKKEGEDEMKGEGGKEKNRDEG
jgi:hypothetical protein